MSTPKVSVLIPTFNVRRFLAENLDAVLAQDFTDFELVISDNCSTDSTFELIQKYAARDSRIRCWQNQTNLGGYANFAMCHGAARGEYIKFLCSDDKLLHPSALRKMVKTLEEHKEVSLVSCASMTIDENSNLLGFRNYFGRSAIWEGRDVIIRCFEAPANLIGEPTLIMFRRDACQHRGNPRYRQIGDLEFCFHFLEKGQFAFIAEPLAAWRRRDGQETEVNRLTGGASKEELWLIQEWFSKPWLKERATRQMLFTQIRHLRKLYGNEASELTSEMMNRLGKGWYAAYALKRKICRPFKKILDQMESRRRVAAARKAGFP